MNILFLKRITTFILTCFAVKSSFPIALALPFSTRGLANANAHPLTTQVFSEFKQDFDKSDRFILLPGDELNFYKRIFYRGIARISMI
ncbi:MAG: hypothetical protein RMX96_26115 [Nostoc sp. ChiSLP02]|nr:hypothetical protein [Nostoc sp. DedSLP05]MDZ8101168.1 hypothetical protein [Nostoc sp. DedSLP01]MDZ8188318.1 hypothetical protein [Nostoc sp. ChiSLP02]